MPPKESQAYKNAHAFQPNRGKKVKEREKSALDTAVSASLAGVCERCSEQLKWKKKYGKFRSAVGARRCNGCQLLTVKAAYHHLCRDCARTRKACAKCNAVITGPGITTAEEQARAVEALTEQMAGMRERDRRAAQRAIDRGLGIPARLGGRGGGEGGEGGSEDFSDSDDDFGDSDDEGDAPAAAGGARAPPAKAAAAAKGAAGGKDATAAEAPAVAGGDAAAPSDDDDDDDEDEDEDDDEE